MPTTRRPNADGDPTCPSPAPLFSADETAALRTALGHLETWRLHGSVGACRGQIVRALGLGGLVGVGDGCLIARGGPLDRGTAASGPTTADAGTVGAEVVGFEGGHTLLAPYGDLTGVTLGADVRVDPRLGHLFPDASWRGRVIDAFGRPQDGGPVLQPGARPYPVQAPPPPAGERTALGPRQPTGVRALDLFTPLCAGQRLGIFAGSGVGKSSLLSMLARAAAADVLVIGLIGERGRELGDFLTRTLGAEGLRRSVVVVATSDQPAMTRRRAAYATMAVAEYFRDQGADVLCLMDSVTRFAMALREIHLAAGEPPTTKGYPPSVFTELPQLLERAGPGRPGSGRITGLFTVLVDGDDTNEPISDAVRGILDGHVVLDRRIAEAGRFPAMDVLKSISRSAPACYAPAERLLVAEARRLMQRYAEMAELIELGAYRPGSNPEVDLAIARRPGLEQVLAQDLDESVDGQDPFARLAAALDVAWPPAAAAR
jgi:flagellum-specific ATP synthase